MDDTFLFIIILIITICISLNKFIFYVAQVFLPSWVTLMWSYLCKAVIVWKVLLLNIQRRIIWLQSIIYPKVLLVANRIFYKIWK